MRRGRRGAAVAAAAAALALAASGCASSGSHSGGSSGTAASSDKTTTVTIDLTPQGCTPKPATITAGAVQFNVTNKDAGSVSEAELRTGDLAKILGEQRT
jgi:iron uptake system component EfeO